MGHYFIDRILNLNLLRIWLKLNTNILTRISYLNLSILKLTLSDKEVIYLFYFWYPTLYTIKINMWTKKLHFM